MKTNRDNCELRKGMILDENPTISQEEREEILEHEAIVKELTESFEQTMRKIIAEEAQERTGCIGHPAWEE